jgi:hypothetical protein
MAHRGGSGHVWTHVSGVLVVVVVVFAQEVTSC